MGIGKRYCAICNKEKEQHFIQQINDFVYIECKCELEQKRIKEERDREYAVETIRKLRQKSSHISPINSSADFNTMIVDQYNEKAIKACKYILEKMLKGDTEGKISLILQGNKGSGKTYIASALINGYNNSAPISEQKIKDTIRGRDNGFKPGEYTCVHSDCKFITEYDLYSVYYDNFNFSKCESPLDEFKRAKKLLVIDDIGTCGADSHKIQAIYNNIIDYRHSNMLPTVITTNLNKSELNRYIGERALDRLGADGYFIDLTSPQSRRI